MKMRNMIATGALVVASLLIVAPAAQAGGGGGGGNGDVITRGSCSGRTDWKLKVKPDDGGLELEFEVDSNVNGQSWNVRIKQNGNRIFSGTRVTQGPSGSFELSASRTTPRGPIGSWPERRTRRPGRRAWAA